METHPKLKLEWNKNIYLKETYKSYSLNELKNQPLKWNNNKDLSIKYLGVIFDEKLTWKYISIKIKSSLYKNENRIPLSKL